MSTMIVRDMPVLLVVANLNLPVSVFKLAVALGTGGPVTHTAYLPVNQRSLLIEPGVSNRCLVCAGLPTCQLILDVRESELYSLTPQTAVCIR